MNSVWALSKLVIKEIFRKKDFYVALILIGVILCYAAELRFYDVGHIVRYLMEIGLALIYLFSVILTMSLAARQYPQEFQNRTCQVLFAKPIRRFEFIAGKFLGSFIAGASCFTVFYVLFLVLVSAKAGSLSAVLALETYYLFLLNLFVVAAMASALSYYLTVSATVSVTIVFYLLISVYGPGLSEVSNRLFWPSRLLGKAVYHALPHFEFFDLRQRFIHGWGPVSPGLILFLTLYALTYGAIFLWAAWFKFRKEYL